MPYVNANGVRLCYDEFGDPNDPALLLIMGLGVQMIGWHEGLCALFAEAGFRVIRFDNRDSGLSQFFHQAGKPSVPLLLARRKLKLLAVSPYKLDDMADDAIALLDELNIDKAHLCGMSMGGMIAQLVALRAPERTLSLCSWMSTDGRDYGLPSPRMLKVLLGRPPKDLTKRANWSATTFTSLDGPTHKMGFDAARAQAVRAIERNPSRAGTPRQLAAIVCAPSRTKALASITAPTLVIHGTDDPLVPFKAGEATAKAIPGARFEAVNGLGHTVPRSLWPWFVEVIHENAHRTV